MAAVRPAARPFILVLAGVNGAGKSSLVGALLVAHGLPWFNPDSYARQLSAQLGLDAGEASARAWAYGHARLQAAIAAGRNYAFETTLGGRSITALLADAAASHDVTMLYCGLASIDLHVARVRLRVAHGGHDIPEAKIRERWVASRANLIRLLPRLAGLQVFDNSADVAPGEDIPDPLRVLDVDRGQVLHPDGSDPMALAATPEWARPIVQAALEGDTFRVQAGASEGRSSLT